MSSKPRCQTCHKPLGRDDCPFCERFERVVGEAPRLKGLDDLQAEMRRQNSCIVGSEL